MDRSSTNKWLIDEKKQIITEKAMLSGMQFDIPQLFQKEMGNIIQNKEHLKRIL